MAVIKPTFLENENIKEKALCFRGLLYLTLMTVTTRTKPENMNKKKKRIVYLKRFFAFEVIDCKYYLIIRYICIYKKISDNSIS